MAEAGSTVGPALHVMTAGLVGAALRGMTGRRLAVEPVTAGRLVMTGSWVVVAGRSAMVPVTSRTRLVAEASAVEEEVGVGG